jgi:gamma-glutamylcyclotransferase (GGCT)/AIG2-like uncharacterized protein YtfP
MERLFAYGTLQDPVIQSAVLGRTLEGQPDALPGFRKSTIAFGKAVYPFVVADESGSVPGTVYAVTAEELAVLDHYETSAYRRFRVTLASGLEAWVYGE